MARSRGALLLGRTGQTQDDIGAVVGVSRAAVAQWMNGSTRPGRPAREKLLATYGIPSEAWDESARKPKAPPSETPVGSAPLEPPALPPPAQAPDPDAVPDGVLGKAKMLEDMAHDMLRDLRADTEAFPLEKAKVMNSIAGTLNLLAKLTGQFELGARLFKLPVWKRIEQAAEKALAKHPEAAAALAGELRAVEKENTYERP